MVMKSAARARRYSCPRTDV